MWFINEVFFCTLIYKIKSITISIVSVSIFNMFVFLLNKIHCVFKLLSSFYSAIKSILTETPQRILNISNSFYIAKPFPVILAELWHGGNFFFSHVVFKLSGAYVHIYINIINLSVMKFCFLRKKKRFYILLLFQYFDYKHLRLSSALFIEYKSLKICYLLIFEFNHQQYTLN